MSRRIEIELTSQRDENEWTWRAAGAKQPKGVLPASVLYSDAKVGDIVRADAEFEIEGITIVGVQPPQAKRQTKVEKIEIVTSDKDFKPVTQALASKGKSDKRSSYEAFAGGGGARGGPGGGGRSGGPGGGGARGGPGGGRGREGLGTRPGGPLGSQGKVQEERPGNDRGGKGGARGGRPERGRSEGARSEAGQPRTGRPERSSGGRPDRPTRPERPARPAAPTFKRLSPKDTRRQAVLTDLAPESRPIAEQLLRGGMPAVRQAIAAEADRAKAEGRPEINSTALVAMAEELLPQLKAAEWMDRAEAAKADVNEIAVRDLRAVVSGADAVARSEESRVLASELRDALERRTNETRESWVKEVATCLDEGRVVRALRLSARPPDAQTKFPAELLERLKSMAEESMTPDTPADRWIIMIDAVGGSPVRRSVEPKGLPSEPGEALLSAAKQAAGRIPALAKQLGVTIPPPPRRTPKPPTAPPPAPTASNAASTTIESPAAQAPAEVTPVETPATQPPVEAGGADAPAAEPSGTPAE